MIKTLKKAPKGAFFESLLTRIIKRVALKIATYNFSSLFSNLFSKDTPHGRSNFVCKHNP